MTEEELTEEEKAEQAAQDKQDWFRKEVIDQLAESDRFQQFVRLNYDIRPVIDHDDKSIRLQVIEVPWEIAKERLMAEAKEALGDESEGIVVAGADVLGKLDKLPKS